MSDESLREFQLNGKQLVFLFMASTVVAVVIFLCGVMVGRGVSTAQAAAMASLPVDADDPTAGALADATPLEPPRQPSEVAPDAPGDDPVYPEVLTGDKKAADLAPVRATPPAVAPTARTTAAAPVTAPPSRPAPAAAASASPARAAREAVEPPGDGFVVQVAATPRRTEADAIRARLQSKGYPAFVTTAGRLFRVRVGKFKDRSEATSVARRLETQERFKPWVTR